MEPWTAAATPPGLRGSGFQKLQPACPGQTGAGQERGARLEVEGGSAREGDDITAQPLKDELFPPPLQLGAGGSEDDRGLQAAPLDRGATEVPAAPVRQTG